MKLSLSMAITIKQIITILLLKRHAKEIVKKLRKSTRIWCSRILIFILVFMMNKSKKIGNLMPIQ